MIPTALREYGSVSSDNITVAPAARFGVDLRRLAWIRPLAAAYASDFQHLEQLYAGNPASPDAWRGAIDRTRRYVRPRREIADVVAAQQERRHAPPQARTAAAKLASADTVAVVTGQQAGAFGGPLFTLLKAITAVQLARRTEAEHGATAVAIFWIDAEDHDWNEVRSCTVLDAELQPRTVTLDAPEGAGDRPVGSLRLDDRVERSLDELAGALPATDFTAATIAQLRGAYQSGAGMAEAFARWLESVLGPHGLVVFDASDPAAKSFARDIFIREIQTAGRTAVLATAAGDMMAAADHAPQVVPHADSAALFRLDGGRRAIKRNGDLLNIDGVDHTVDALAAEAAASPERFSPNVLLRPVVQDALFPTICYVAGPSELAYLGQLRGIYEHFGVPMPLMYPRATATLVDSAATRFLSRYNLPIEELQPRDEAALNRLLQAQLPAEVTQSLKDASARTTEAMQRVIDAMPELDPTLAGAAKTTLGRMEHDLRNLESKVIQAAKRRDDTLRRQFTRTQALVFPDGHPQERSVGVVFFLNRYGPALVDRLLEDLPLDLGQHWVITL